MSSSTNPSSSGFARFDPGSESGSRDPWFALRVSPNHEKAVGLHLGLKGFDVFLPVCRKRNRWADRFQIIETPLFKGYLFARFARSDVHPILSTPGVLQIVGAGRRPEPIPESEISAIRCAVEAHAQLRECDFFEKGQRAVVISGPMKGLEGTVVTLKQRTRLILSISILQRSVAVEVEESLVRVESGPIFTGVDRSAQIAAPLLVMTARNNT